MDQITVTIGRKDNVNGLELTDSEWTQFHEHLVSLFEDHGFGIVVDSEGFGEWGGVTEPNRVLIGVREPRDYLERITKTERQDIFERLAHLAFVYDQDAIAFGYGTSVLVESVA